MKTHNLTYLIILSVSLLCSCLQEVQIESEEPESNYDIKIMSLAKAVNAAVRENTDYRCLIKEEVSKLVDGDYDYLFSTSMNHLVVPSEEFITRSGCGEDVTVRELLSYYLDPSVLHTKSSLEYLDEILSEYPEMQISVPVHADEWNPETYIPAVAVIPENCEYPVTKTLPGIDADGNEIEIDAINEPDEPVIVVGLSERLSEPPSISFARPFPGQNQSSVELTGAYLNNAVRLVYTPNNVTTVHSVKLYRTNANSSVYNLLTSGLPFGNQFVDWDVEELQEYSYYVEADCTIPQGLLSRRDTLVSNVVTLVINGQIPQPVLNLKAVNEYSTKNFITWDNPSVNKYPTHITRTTPTITDSLIATLDPTATYFFDEPVVKGEKWTYIVKKYNPYTGGYSSHSSTYVRNPYRNPSGVSKVMLRKIELDRSQIEGWFEGRPELYIATYGHLKTSSGDIIVDTLSHFSYRFPAGSNGESPAIESTLADWSFFDDDLYYPVINIQAVEYDRGTSDMDLSVDAKIGVKLSDDIGLQANGRFNFHLSNNGQDCGIVYLRYYQDPNSILVFPGCGLKFYLSE